MAGNFPRRALISVSDKIGLAELAKGLNELGFEIVSTGGTRAFLQQQGAKVIDIAEYTGFPEIMDGRVKTLHPKVHGAILGRPDVPHHAEAIAAHGIIPFELIVVNLYPFEATIAKPGCTVEDAIENIDIGGPSMVRSAAKNHEHVGIVTCPSQYERVLTELRAGKLSHEFKRELAAAAFACTARYDRAIADYMAGMVGKLVAEEVPEGVTVDATKFPRVLHLDFERRMPLRYGENPHQAAAFYVETGCVARPDHREGRDVGKLVQSHALPDGQSVPPSLAAFEKLHGKELSYNNLLDLDSAMAIVREFDQPAAVVIKHNNPCGCAISDSLSSAFEKAYAGDPVSSFGGIFGLNRVVDLATAEQFCIPDRFVEAIIAPGFTDEAFQLLTTKPKWKNNVRLLQVPGWQSSSSATAASMEYRRVSGGLLVQTRDDQPDPEADWKIVTTRQPTDAELRDLRFAWRVCKHVKSNAIVFAKDGAITGTGAGQMSRLDSSEIAAKKSADRCQGGVVASDAFFPFRDGIDQAAKAGILAAIQPGGSRNDPEVIAAANEHGMTMIFTGRRHFKH